MHDFDVASFLRTSVEEVWDRKMFGRIVELYAPAALIHIGNGRPLHGGVQLLEQALQWAAAFPDLRLFIDDLFYVQRDEGYTTSLCWTAVAHHSGPSMLGSATGRRVVISGIVVSRIEDGRFVEQWIQLADGDLIRQLDLDEQEAVGLLWPEPDDAESLLSAVPGVVERITIDSPTWLLDEDTVTDSGAFIRTMVDTIWNQRQIGEIGRFFAPHYREWGPGSRTLFGREELESEIIALLGAFPDLRLYIDDLFWEGEPQSSSHSMMRWTLLGTNTGYSRYGAPSGASLRLAGLTTRYIERGQCRTGRTAYSELNLARQLIRVVPPTQCAESR